MFNMFIMSRAKVDEYCSWLFPLLEGLEERIDDSGYDAFAARYPGRVSERLMDVWLRTTGLSLYRASRRQSGTGQLG
uniref:CAZy families GT2/GT8 protein n=1 Tax=uncultured Bifidobacterium sp. TaxID=165187 RepID=A0A060BK55_9BIFI|nr:CAZy families GT2/GT8 protein [uncultured Bifidobacterium sp.]